jgi:predicted cupin superfamily sugar epimerase
MHPRAAEIIARLNLSPHPERGFFVESYRARVAVTAASHPGARAAGTAIYFLVTDDAPATYLHRLRSDEVFHLYEGGPLDILRLAGDGSVDVERLGTNLAAGERPQIVIPAGTWFGTELAPGAPFCLAGCSVAPGFDFADFELAEGPELAARYPAAADRIARMFRPPAGKRD